MAYTMSSNGKNNTVIPMAVINNEPNISHLMQNITNIYGKFEFLSFNKKKADYLKVDVNRENINDKVKNVLEVMLHKNGWNLKEPKLILSVTGGAKKFTVPRRLKNALRVGLDKAAAKTDAWIITGGSNVGVMQLFGEAVSREAKKNLVLLGVTTWGVIAHRDEISSLGNTAKQPYTYTYKTIGNNGGKKKTFIDQNHTNFIFVDEGRGTEFGQEIDFRTKLEIELSKRNKEIPIPMILVVVNGGPNTFRTVENAMESNIPILVLEESKGCADLIANLVKLINDPLYDGVASSDDIEKLVINSKILDEFKDPTSKEKNKEKVINGLTNILIKYQKNTNLITVFRLDSDEDSGDFDKEIFKTFLKNQKDEYFKKIELALFWNRIDIIKNYILTGEEVLSHEEKGKLLERALIENKPELVELLLDYGIRINEFYFDDKLLDLYNNGISANDKQKPNDFRRILPGCLRLSKNEPVHFGHLKQLLKKLVYSNFTENFIPSRDPSENDHSVDDTKSITYLFFWAILHGYIEIAKIFWKRGKFQIANALLASKILKSISDYVIDLKFKNEKHSEDFENLAIGVLNEFNTYTHDEMNPILLLEVIKYYNNQCILSIAFNCECESFMAELIVQDTLTSLWLNRMADDQDIIHPVKIIFHLVTFGLFSPFSLFNSKLAVSSLYDEEEMIVNNSKQTSTNNQLLLLVLIFADHFLNLFNFIPCTPARKYIENFEHNRKFIDSKGCNYCTYYFYNLRDFWTSPKIRFINHFISYILFLILFSYLILFQFNDFVKNEFVTYTTFSGDLIKNFIFWQYLLYGWIGSLLISELDQFFSYDPIIKTNVPYLWRIINKFKSNKSSARSRSNFLVSSFKYINNAREYYYKDEWNILDSFGLLLFILFIVLKYANTDTTDDTDIIVAIKIIILIDLIIWYTRSLSFFSISESIGPTYEIIKDIIIGNTLFFVIILIFTFAFGIAIEATTPNDNLFGFDLLRKIINVAYWPVFGQIDVLQCINNESTCDDTSYRKENGYLLNFDFSLIFVYMIITLITTNILIARFNQSFAVIQLKSSKLWRFDRYRLVLSYASYPILPAPFNVPYYVVSSIYSTIKYCTVQKTGPTTNSTSVFDFETEFAQEYFSKLIKDNSIDIIPKSILENSPEIKNDNFINSTRTNMKKLDEKLDKFNNAFNSMQAIEEKLHKIEIEFSNLKQFLMENKKKE